MFDAGHLLQPDPHLLGPRADGPVHPICDSGHGHYAASGRVAAGKEEWWVCRRVEGGQWWRG